MATPPLSGVRVADLTRVWAGPYGTKMLGDLGAEVIKVEAPSLPDGRTGYPLDNKPSSEAWRSSGVYQKNNRSKLSCTIDLRQPEGKEVFKQLVAISDIVIENYSPRVMPQFGLDYEALKQVNPEIIMVSMPGFGSDGPQKNWLAYGTTLDSHAGLVSLTGYRDGPPHRMAFAIGDPVGGMYAALACIAALLQRRAGGGGVYVDLAQSEALIQFVGPALVGWSMNGRAPDRTGNRDPDFAPQGCYPCEGDDEWVAISVTSDAEWAGLCDVIERPDLAETFPTLEDRARGHDEIDELIGRWTSTRPKHDAASILQDAGVPAGPVNTSRDLLLDEHMLVRGALPLLELPGGSTRPQVGVTTHLSRTPAEITRTAPEFGEHNGYVFKELLGLSDEAYDELLAKSVIADAPAAAAPPEAPTDLERWIEVGLVSDVDPDYRRKLREFYGAVIPE